ncbi:MAG: DNA-processing protein DprA [Gordonia sp. (in: high G+C Gram-positive bacteria)]
MNERVGSGDDVQLRAWAYLTAVAEPPCEPLRKLVAAVGAVEAAAAVRTRKVPAGHEAVLTATRARAATDDSARHLERADRLGARLVTPDDPEWPGWSLLALSQLDHSIREREPLALWVRGPARLDEIGDASIALVGSRAASSYGEYVAARFAGELSAAGWGVLSGGAYGIDGAAHRSALASGGVTVAVLACGIDRDYPAGHGRLLGEIAERGAVLTEYAPGTSAARHRFLTRNRLVAALSSAVIVVEAARRSGAASTAAWARRLARPVGAVPGSIASATSVGAHRLIADDLAVLVASAEAVIALAAPDGGGDPGRGSERPTDRLSHEQRRVHDAIPGRGSATIAEISYAAGLDTAVVRAALAAMEVAGLVAGDTSGWQLA